ncbi:MAG: sporulation transcriptional regulator SpoIIID [Clostridia bacterium]|nr:sporulation transcriptional regulator SpoIIID [Clostridia bacterium]MDD4376207.1 sporulation transcriptional regulator SpoIIID [Clostridia bacterium]
MRLCIKERTLEMANYIIENSATLRTTAKTFGLSKSTVHKDIRERLPKFDVLLAQKAQLILNVNKSERHIRGGEATRIKYSKK